MNCNPKPLQANSSDIREVITFRGMRQNASKLQAVKLLRAAQPALGLRDAIKIVNDLFDGSAILMTRLTRFERTAFECVGFTTNETNRTVHYL